MNKGRTVKTRDDYLTPPDLLETARKLRGDFALDPATNASNPTRAKIICTVDDDVTGLEHNWYLLVEHAGGGSVWLNPPFSNKLAFLKKCAQEALFGVEIQVLVPCECASKWWQEHCSPRTATASAVCYLRKRPTFLDPFTGRAPIDAKGKPTSAMFGCAVVYFGPSVGKFESVWCDQGDVDLGRRV